MAVLEPDIRHALAQVNDALEYLNQSLFEPDPKAAGKTLREAAQILRSVSDDLERAARHQR